MAADLPVVTIVLFIASGTLVFFLMFLFGKRQIMRFALKSARKPHISIGADAPKELKDEIQRRLGLVQNARFEPTLLSEQVQNRALTETNHYFHRMKALDAFTNAVECCRSQDKSVPLRSAKQSIQLYLFSLCPSTPSTEHARTIHQFCCAYNHARHNPAMFGDAEFINYMELLDKVIRLIKNDCKRRLENQTLQTLDTEVRLRRGRGDGDTVETVIPQSGLSCGQPKSLSSTGMAARPEHLEQINLVDQSSGYSSTDRSSSSRGSAERLISPLLRIMHQQDEAV